MFALLPPVHLSWVRFLQHICGSDIAEIFECGCFMLCSIIHGYVQKAVPYTGPDELLHDTEYRLLLVGNRIYTSDLLCRPVS